MPSPERPPATWELLIVRYGTLASTRSHLYLHYDAYGEPDAPATMDYYFWVARNPARTVVIDTGYRVADGQSRGRTTLVDPREALAALVPAGIPTSTIVTHCHYDHIGNLDAVPGSSVLIAADELEFWRGPIAARPLFAGSGSADGMHELDRAEREGRLATFTEQTVVHPGIRVVRTGGHTPGQSIVLVDTTEGTVLIASDAAHFDDELELDRPFHIMSDLPTGYRALERIRKLREGGTAHHVLAGHEPGLLDRLRMSDEGPRGLVGVIGGQS